MWLDETGRIRRIKKVFATRTVVKRVFKGSRIYTLANDCKEQEGEEEEQ